LRGAIELAPFSSATTDEQPKVSALRVMAKARANTLAIGHFTEFMFVLSAEMVVNALTD
jgi:hypothetical protein